MLEKAGYKLAVTTEYGRITPEMEALKLPRVRMSREDSITVFINKVK